MTGRRGNIRIVPTLITALAAAAVFRALSLGVSIEPSAASAETPTIPVSTEAPSSVAESIGPQDGRLAARLAVRKAALDERETLLETREQVLAAAEKTLAAQVEALRQEKQQLLALREDRSRAVNDDFKALSRTYERMRPKDAAEIFEALGDEILIPVAAGMRTQSLAAVMAELSAEKARALTTALADYRSEAAYQPPASSDTTP